MNIEKLYTATRGGKWHGRTIEHMYFSTVDPT